MTLHSVLGRETHIPFLVDLLNMFLFTRKLSFARAGAALVRVQGWWMYLATAAPSILIPQIISRCVNYSILSDQLAYIGISRRGAALVSLSTASY